MNKRRVKLKDIEKATLHILETCPASRNNLGLLVGMVWGHINPEVRGLLMVDVMEHTAYYNLPSFESVSRTRRRIVSERPDLKGNDEVEREREKNVEEFEEYART